MIIKLNSNLCLLCGLPHADIIGCGFPLAMTMENFHRKIILLGVMIYGPSAARSLFHDPEPNIFPTDPTKFGQ